MEGSVTSNLKFMIFGDVFLRNYIVTFDKANNRMGFYGYAVIFLYLVELHQCRQKTLKVSFGYSLRAISLSGSA
jgi:hypothetical protein